MRRLAAGGVVDRAVPLGFRFDGRELTGLAGDTLASALLANDVHVIGPSPLLGRPRGVMTAGPEEPCAMVSIEAPWTDVIVPATMVTLVDNLVAESRIGKGRLPATWRPTPRATHRHAHVETLVVGGGAGGLRAALDAADRGDRVLVVDERSAPGGTSVSTDVVDGASLAAWVAQAAGRLEQHPDTTLLANAVALGLYDHGYVVVCERFPAERTRLWHVRAERVVLGTGAHERPIAFGGNDRPGVMLSGAVRSYLDRYAVLPGERAVVFTTNDAAYETARAVRDAGAQVVAIADVRKDAAVQTAARADGFEVLSGWTVARTEGSPRVERVRLTDGRSDRSVDADLLAVSGGWNPVVSLHRAIGGGLRYDPGRACFVPEGGPPWLSVVGAAAGDVPAAEPYWFVPADDLSEHFVDFQRDQTVADVQGALDAGFRSVEHVKRATYIGTAVDQGRTSGMLTAAVVNQLLGADPGAQGPTSARPPWMPVPFHVLAGPYRGGLFDPVRTTPIHPWHAAHGSVFEAVGQWHRPRYYPRGDEDMSAAVGRECLAVRTGVGMQDASTLGKVEVAGPDAAVFLDRMYTNAMSTLAVGKIRYGLMVGLDGMVFDDGVAMRLAEDRYLVTTTTGGAARVLDRFEEWLQTEWPDLRVYCTSVTEQWSTLAVAGPRAREVLGAAGTGVDLSNDAFPFMTWRDGTVAGAPARIARVSFSGELAFEVNVDGRSGLGVWEALLAAGQPAGITPYGTEAMHVLRAEKGFPIVGQDTDGTVTPQDLGMSWIVNMMKGDFVGRRSLRRPDLIRPGRLQLVGLLPVDPDALLPEGAQLVMEDTGRMPMSMLGHVTSSYRSAQLGRTFALALVKDGRSLGGTTVYAPTLDGTIAAAVTAPVFYDPEGVRRDG